MTRPKYKCSCLDPGAKRSGFGSLRILPSGRHQARYVGPDGRTHNAPTTFTTHGDAETYLATVRSDVVRSSWAAPSVAKVAPRTFGEFAEAELRRRATRSKAPLKGRTANNYRLLLDKLILPTFETVPVVDITPADVRAWYDELDPGKPVFRAHAYSLLKSILRAAVNDDLLVSNPCRIEGASTAETTHKPKPATLAQLETIVAEMPEQYRLMVLLAAWCAMRYGELAELRRRDVDVKAGVIHIRRGVTWVKHEPIVDTPKSKAGARDVAIPPHLLPAVRAHLREHAGIELLFPSRAGIQLTSSTLYTYYGPARRAAGREDLHFHDLRHTGAKMAGDTGATLKELMVRLGHSTPTMAIKYQHAELERDKVIAAKLSKIAKGGTA
jgi:integrase